MCEAEPLCAENIALKDIDLSRRGELIMHYKTFFCSCLDDLNIEFIDSNVFF